MMLEAICLTQMCYVQDHNFEDEHYFYRFEEDESKTHGKVAEDV